MAIPSRLVRIFISSTFRDFLGERDELVKRVFPELRRRCKARQVEVLEVDLRWGITEEQSRRGETLGICLKEIDRCRPSAPVFFIGLIGERYGWVPEADYYPKDVLTDPELKWVKKHVGGRSVTELEILHGVLRNPAMAERAFFYFRNDGYEKRHWAAIHAGYPELKPETFTNAAEVDPAGAAAKQEDLKRRIRESGLRHAPRSYETPVDLVGFVLEDLWAHIDAAFPAADVPDELERHWIDHEVFAQSRVRGYVRRAGLFEQLDEVLQDGFSTVKVVTGESGGGKSALLAAWMRDASDRLPHRRFVHYIGGTPESSTAGSVVLRLMETIRRWGAVKERIPEDFGEAVRLLPQWLAEAARDQEGGVLLVLDALNQMDDSQDRSLWWLPSELPEGVRLVASTLRGPSEEALRGRGWLRKECVLEVQPLDDGERRAIIGSYLERFTKKLADPIVDRLAAAPQTANALFLKVVLDELRVRASHEALGPMVERMLEAAGPVELFVQVLKGLEEFDRERPNLVREALGYLHAARRGLTESELLQLLSDHPEPASHPLPRGVWSPLYLALEDYLVSRNGRLGFFHDYLREAVEREYLDEEWERRRVHSRLGEVARAWRTERFSPSLRAYGLAFGAHHLRWEGDHEKLWQLLEDEEFRVAQRAEFQRVDEAVEALRQGVEMYAGRDGETGEDDARLCWLMLRCGEVVEAEHSNFGGVFQGFVTRPIEDPLRLEDALERLQALDATWFYHGAALLLLLESELRCERGERLPRWVQESVISAAEDRVPVGEGVFAIDWLNERICGCCECDIVVRLARLAESPGSLLQTASRHLAEDGDYEGALKLCSGFAPEIEDPFYRVGALIDVGVAMSKAGEPPRAAKVFEEARTVIAIASSDQPEWGEMWADTLIGSLAHEAGKAGGGDGMEIFFQELVDWCQKEHLLDELDPDLPMRVIDALSIAENLAGRQELALELLAPYRNQGWNLEGFQIASILPATVRLGLFTIFDELAVLVEKFDMAPMLTCAVAELAKCGAHVRSVDWCDRTLKALAKVEDLGSKVNALCSLAVSMDQIQERERMIEVMDSCVETGEAIQEVADRCRAYLKIADTYMTCGCNKECLLLTKKVCREVNRLKNPAHKAGILHGLGSGRLLASNQHQRQAVLMQALETAFQIAEADVSAHQVSGICGSLFEAGALEAARAGLSRLLESSSAMEPSSMRSEGVLSVLRLGIEFREYVVSARAVASFFAGHRTPPSGLYSYLVLSLASVFPKAKSHKRMLMSCAETLAWKRGFSLVGALATEEGAEVGGELFLRILVREAETGGVVTRDFCECACLLARQWGSLGLNDVAHAALEKLEESIGTSDPLLRGHVGEAWGRVGEGRHALAILADLRRALEETEGALEASTGVAEDIRLKWAKVQFLSMAALIHAAVGDERGVSESFKECIMCCPNGAESVHSLQYVIDQVLRCGRFDGALELLCELRDTVAGLAYPELRLELLYACASAMARMGAWESALGIIEDEEVGTDLVLSGRLHQADESLTQVIRALAKDGEWEMAVERLERLVGCIHKVRVRIFLSEVCAELGDVGGAGMWIAEAAQLSVGLEDGTDQSEAFGAVMAVICKYALVIDPLVEAINRQMPSREAFGFLTRSESDQRNVPMGLGCARRLATLCPERLEIGVSLIGELLRAHLRAGNDETVGKVGGLCPQLGLAGLFRKS